MFSMDRRKLIKTGAALGAAGATGLLDFAKAWAQQSPFKPEPNATISILRWKRFVEAEDAQFMKIVEAFTKATGVKVNVSNESFDDIQPKASVAANTGQGPDMVWGLHSLPHLFPDKCTDVSDVADYLGKKYGGWVPAAVATGQSKGKWIAVPVAFNGGYINYRISAVQKAGFKGVPGDTAGFLELCRALKKNNTPSGFALGHATGDANGWIHWLLWSHGSYLIDKDEKVIINSPETAKALDYAKQLYETFVPGTASWNDSSNNKAFLAGELYLTANGISIYAAAKAQNMTAIAEDMDHAAWPVGPVGKPQELQLLFPLLIFKYSKNPKASKAFVTFLMEAENYNPWLEAAAGYLTQPLNAYDNNPVWTKDPKNTVFRDAGKRTLPASGIGPVTEKAAAAISDFILVDMVANYCTGREDVKGAIAQAERQAKRLFR
ncbi:ABC transporter substrate-binding protein [Alsobacter sp. SYSU M60028]|uniref:ABC transporter substrate-binding protein n=1 Tax=Alsobacter ponti TaxID=2962936 RepID=A0ABT1LEQ0_9HYPH|nr:ABC transporter substrate-binding protein [Alsobacter ponti]MCP8939581.1 ABC transporter substrate-binding protein [Alsobacter ponti]